MAAAPFIEGAVELRPTWIGALSDAVSPDQMLDRIGEVINEAGLTRTMDANARWFRARVHSRSERYTSAADPGTASRKWARFPNRMSPAGIPMFYGARDIETAIAETYIPNGKPVTVTVAKFRTAREAWVVDLTRLPKVPSIFDEHRRHLRAPISFLLDFVEDLMKPIKKDGREHTEYVPTQIVTEYLRHIFRTEGGQRVKGVIYRSARKAGGKCCVLFVRNKQCCDATTGWEMDKNMWLGLKGKPKRYDFG